MADEGGPTELFDAEVEEWSGVDEPANQHARVVLLKGKESLAGELGERDSLGGVSDRATFLGTMARYLGMSSEDASKVIGDLDEATKADTPGTQDQNPPQPPEEGSTKGAGTMADDNPEDKAKMEPGEMGAGDEPTVDQLLARIAELEAEKAEAAKAEDEDDDETKADEDEDDEDEAKSKADEVTKSKAEIAKMRDEIVSKLAAIESREAIQKVRDEFADVPAVRDEGVAKAIVAIRKADPDSAKSIEQLLKSLNAQVKKGALFGRNGSNGSGDIAGSAVEKVRKAANEAMKESDGKLTIDQAMDKVLGENPDLYLEYEQERGH